MASFLVALPRYTGEIVILHLGGWGLRGAALGCEFEYRWGDRGGKGRQLENKYPMKLCMSYFGIVAAIA
jgi:hypothetical protein